MINTLDRNGLRLQIIILSRDHKEFAGVFVFPGGSDLEKTFGAP